MTFTTPTAQSGSHRNWHYWYEHPPVPLRTYDWMATPDDYDGAPDSGDTRVLYATTSSGIRTKIDAWITENELHRTEKL